MEDKKLDFSLPLLSVRRFPIQSTAASSEVDDKSKANNSRPCVPPLPYYKPDLKSGPVRNPGTIPFTWEQIPGRPKDGLKSPTLAPQRLPIAPRLPPGRNAKQNCFSVGSDDHTMPMETQSSLNVNLNDNEDSKKEIDRGSSHSEDSNETYLDALSTLSRTESFFFNCSESDVSGLDGPDLTPPGTSMDPQVRDLMMGRFLPASKAMTSETPHYAFRKHPVAHERHSPRVVIRGGNEGPSLCQDNHSILPESGQDQGGDGRENEESDYESENSVAKACGCGLFPRFGLRNSLFLFNPVPEMRLQAPVPSAYSVRNTSHYASSSTSTTSTSKNLACQSVSVRSLSHKRVLGLSLERKNGGSSNSFATHVNSQLTFRELLAGHTEDSGSTSPLVERTLYIDSVQKQESQKSDTNIWNEKEMQQPGIFSSEKLNEELPVDMKDFGKHHKQLNLASPTVHDDGNEDLKHHESPKTDGYKKCEGYFSEFPLGLLPLPQSPSDSWLSRTLPSISPRKNPSQRSYNRNVKTNLRSQDSMTASVNPSWETIVKTTNDHRGYEYLTLAAAKF